MDDYIEYQILTGEDEEFENDNSSDNDSGGWIILVLIIVIRLFNELLENHPEYKVYIPSLSESTVKVILDGLNMKVKKQEITDFVMGRYSFIKK